MNTEKSKGSSNRITGIANLVTPLQHSLENQTRRRLSKRIVNEQVQMEISMKFLDMETYSVIEDENERVSEIVSNLISKNKINSKNAFQIPLIDVSEMQIFQQGDDGAWSKISSTLQNSSKIYGYRVDCVSQNINKLTDSMARSLDTKNIKQSQINKFYQIKQFQNFESSSQYNNRKIQIHLDEQKLKSQNLQMKSRIQVNQQQIRRIMDQTGIHALILANFPIQSDLSIGITSMSQPLFLKTNTDKMMPYKKDKFSKPQQRIQIFDKIFQINRLFFKTQDQTKQLLLQDIYNQLDYLENRENLQFLECRQCEPKQIENQTYEQQIKGWELEFDQSFKNVSKVQLDTKKKQKQTKVIKLEIKRQKRQKKNIVKKAMQQRILEFSPSVTLSREVLRLPKLMNQQKLKYDRREKQNVYQNLVSSYEASERSANFSFCSFQENRQQNNKLKSCHDLLNIQEQLQQKTSQVSIPNDFDGENIRKVPQIRQTKQQLQKIINDLWQLSLPNQNPIKFSKLYQIHKLNSSNCRQAIDFLAILHLANQLGLSLKQTQTLDFTIAKSSIRQFE